VRFAWLVVVLLLATPSAAAAEIHWSVRASASGSYMLYYGDEGDSIDGQADGVWAWQLRALASGADLDTDITAFRMQVEEASNVVLADGSPICRAPASGSVGWVRDSRVGLHLARAKRGFQVDHPFFDLLAGCHVGAHGMSLYDGAGPAETPIARGAFRPRRDRAFERTWTQQIALDRAHESGASHTFSASGGLTISVRRISARAARALKIRLRRTPRSRLAARGALSTPARATR
jgi:hypothetical protein